ncbi:MAG TPA: hypothetical protein DEQ17_03270 [Prevotella sp.]|nr:hypothetical protein [Prevotella sp.]
MAIFYRKQQFKIEGSQSYGKWFGKAVSMGDVDTRQLAEEISHSTTVTRSDIMAVLIELFEAMKRHLQASHTVVLDEIGSFKVGIKCKATEKAEDFTSSKISGYRVLFKPDTKFVANGQISLKGKRKGSFVKSLLEGVKAEELPSATTDTAESTEGKTD